MVALFISDTVPQLILILMPMKTKVLTYSKCKIDKVVHRYFLLHSYNEHIFFYTNLNDPQNIDYGTLGLVLKVGHTYFYFTIVGIENLLDRRQMNIVTNFAKNFFVEIERSMQKGEYILGL